jgi:nuclear GTP-binding protein
LAKVKPRHIEKTYEIKGYNNYIEFLEQLGRKGGRLLKGGDVDIDGVAKMVINDFLRGKIPWFTPPPGSTTEAEKEGVEGRHGKLGEMGKKRKRPAEGDAVDAVGADDAAAETIDTASDGDSIEDLSVGSISDDVDSESDEEEDGGIPFEGFDAEDDDGKAGSD